MFKIVMVMKNGHSVDMPFDKNLNLFEAQYRADLYSKKNRDCYFRIVNVINNDIEYETERTW